MDFDFNQEQYQLRDSVRSFLEDKWGPKKARASLGKFDQNLWNGLCDLGLQTLLVPEKYGGAGLGLIDMVLVLEEFGYSLVPAAMSDTLLAAEILSLFGTDEQKDDFLPKIVTGNVRIAFAHASSDSTSVVAAGSGSIKLNGKKIAVQCASVASHFLVSACNKDGFEGLYLCDATNVKIRDHHAVDPTALLGEVSFEETPASFLGSKAVHRLLLTSAFAASAQMVGISSKALDIAVAYAKDRKQFDRAIGSFQAIKHKCADMFVALEGARSASYFASWALQDDAINSDLAVSIAKSTCGDACRQICNESMQIHGGVGFTWDFDIHFFMKRGKLLEYQYGDATQHRERVAQAVLD